MFEYFWKKKGEYFFKEPYLGDAIKKKTQSNCILKTFNLCYVQIESNK